MRLQTRFLLIFVKLYLNDNIAALLSFVNFNHEDEKDQPERSYSAVVSGQLKAH